MSQWNNHANGPTQPEPDDNNPYLQPYVSYKDLEPSMSAQTHYGHPPVGNLQPTYQPGRPIDARKQQHYALWRSLFPIPFVILAIGLAMMLPIHSVQEYNSYQNVKCTITDKYVEESVSHDKNGKVTSIKYYPTLVYRFEQNGTVQSETSNYDGPSKTSYQERSSAQAVIDQYEINQQFLCWYLPDNSSRIYLVLNAYSSGELFLQGIVFSIFTSIYALIAYLIIVLGIWRRLILRQRGSVTTGTVVRNEQRKSKNGTYTVSIINYQTFEEPQRNWEMVSRMIMVPGDTVPICYDPYFPEDRIQGTKPEMTFVIPCSIGIIVLNVGMDLIMQAAFNIV